MKTNLLYKIFFALIALIAVAILYFIPMELGGDIVEYHGMTDSLIKSRTLRLTDTAAYNIATYLSPGYLNDPGYYIKGVDGDRYPVHFFLYSFLAVPVRLALHFLHINELFTLRLTNLILLTAGLFFLMKKFLSSDTQRIALLLLVFTSPIVSFIIWPGPDIYFLLLLLIGLFYFFRGSVLKAMCAVALASWHSQPLLIVVLAMAGYYLFDSIRLQKTITGQSLTILLRPFMYAAGVLALTSLPYLYNLYIFNTLSPWTLLQDGWTVINGFGLQNASLKKLLEMFFDLDIGLLWYAPLTVILGGIVIASRLKEKKTLFLSLTMLVTCFFYQTNPAWHYGTAGYGPSKHVVFLLPFFLYFSLQYKRKTKWSTVLIAVLVLWQISILGINGYLAPKLSNALYHSPYATFALQHFPALYNPTPEIFVDRTNHLDVQHPTSAVYKVDGVCKKAYILQTDKALLEKECGKTPEKYLSFFEDPLKRKANTYRTIKAKQVTFWPDPASCGKEYFTSEQAPFVCMKTKDQVMKETKVFDYERIDTVPNFVFPGIWRIKDGPLVDITIPPGYIIDYSALNGIYIHY